MRIRVRQASPTDSPTLMHIEHCCRTAAMFLPAAMRDPGLIKPRQWRAWLTCAPPFNRNPTSRAGFVAYEHNDILGFITVTHDSIFGGYAADVAGLYVLPRYRRLGVGGTLLVRAAQWLLTDDIERATADCYAHDPARRFFERMGGVVIASTSDDADLAAVITYGFVNLKALAARGA